MKSDRKPPRVRCRTAVAAAATLALTWGAGCSRMAPPVAADTAKDTELRKRLTSEQYAVTQEGKTEPPFHNLYWDNHAPGIYVDVVSGDPLFCSLDKFDSGTGWPSFTKPIEKQNVRTKDDDSFGMHRTEVRAKSGAHLGHLFDDGPAPLGTRYCMNSAALRFIPLSEIETDSGGRYKAYRALFPPDARPSPVPSKKP